MKLSLLMIYVPRKKGSLAEVRERGRVLNSTWSRHAWERSRKPGCAVVLVQLQHVAERLVVHTWCPAFSPSRTQTQQSSQAYTIRLLLCQKWAASLFYSVEKSFFRWYKMSNGIKVKQIKDMQLIGTCIKHFIHLNLVGHASLKDI